MRPEPFLVTHENCRVVLRLFRRGDDTIEIARRFHVGEDRIERMLHQARRAEQVENVQWAPEPRS